MTLDVMPIAPRCAYSLYSSQLALNNNRICDTGAAELATALAANSALTWVCMAWHIASLAELCEVRMGRPLRHAVHAPICSAQLKLNNNHIGALGAAAIANALTTNHTLTHVCCGPILAERGEARIDAGCDVRCATLCLLLLVQNR